VRQSRFDNDGVMHIPLALKSQLEGHMKLNPNVPIEIAFGDVFWDVECTFDRIEGMYNFVTDKVIQDSRASSSKRYDGE
jgi:hypothetical protein